MNLGRASISATPSNHRTLLRQKRLDLLAIPLLSMLLHLLHPNLTDENASFEQKPGQGSC